MVDDKFEPFHSAVNRIPVLRQMAQQKVREGSLPRDVFADFAASGHDHMAADRYCGLIDLEITVKTPLIFGEQRDAKPPAQGKVIKLPTDKQGKVFMPPTMVKGMISRAYETLTCSRFRVFGNLQNPTGQRHRDDDRNLRLTYRSDAAGAQRLVPFRVVGQHEDGTLQAVLLRGDTATGGDQSGRGNRYHAPPAAILRVGDLMGSEAAFQGEAEVLERLAPHGKPIQCNLIFRTPKPNTPFGYWLVTEIFDTQSKEWCRVLPEKEHGKPGRTLRGIAGYVYRTTPSDAKPCDLYELKRDERVFFDVSGDLQEFVIDEYLADSWRLAVESYRRKQTKKQLLNRIAADEGSESLRVGSLGYAVVASSEVASDTHVRVLSLTPTMVGRRTYQTSPAELASDQQVALKRSRFGSDLCLRGWDYAQDVFTRVSCSCCSASC